MGKRLVVLPWHCSKSADCCQGPRLVMTRQEHALLEATTHRSLLTEPAPRGLVAMLGAPCPMLKDNLCSVYPVRPYNCRRFGCYRPDVTKEPFEKGTVEQLGCVNLADRLGDRRVRRDYALNQRKAMRWARKMGWSEAT